MNSKLQYVEDWVELASKTKWSAEALAKKCGVSERTLRRHFLKETGANLRIWLAERRQQHALKLLQNGSSVKETAASLGYKQPANFSRKYKSHWGNNPSLKPLATRSA
jgi:AraC-like DNA-binding protein